MSDENPATSPATQPTPSGTTSEQTTQPAADRAAPADKGGTILDAPGDKPSATPANFPENWRSLAADGDEKLLKELERYSDPKALAKSWREQKAAISKGAAKSPLPEGATPEQEAEWRQANGIPAKADEYKLELPNGLTIGDQDKPIVSKILEAAHGENLTPRQVSSVVAKYYEVQEEQAAQQYEAVKAARAEAEERLRADWGPEFKPNVNAAKSLMVKTFGEETASRIMAATNDSGVPLGNDAQFLRGIVELSRQLDPAATLLPSAGGDRLQSIDGELAELRKRMGTPEWYKDKPAQERYLALTRAKEKMADRAA